MHPTTTHPTDDRLEIGSRHREIIDQVLDTWSLQALEELCERPLRFNAIRHAVPARRSPSLRCSGGWSVTESSSG